MRAIYRMSWTFVLKTKWLDYFWSDSPPPKPSIIFNLRIRENFVPEYHNKALNHQDRVFEPRAGHES